MVEDDVPALYEALVSRLAPRGLAYLHHEHHGDDGLFAMLRALWPACLILNRSDADVPVRLADIETGRADVIATARWLSRILT